MGNIRVTLRGITGIVDKEPYITAKWQDLQESFPSLTRETVAEQLDLILSGITVGPPVEAYHPIVAAYIRDDKPEVVHDDYQ